MHLLEKNINKFYLFSFLQDLTFFTPIFVVFLLANQLSLKSIMLLQSSYLLFNLLLEIPMGILADKYGYKKSLVIGPLFCMFGFIFFAVGDNFLDFFLAMALYAIGASLISGSDEALLFETLKKIKQEDNYLKIFGKARAFTVLGATIASIVGGFIAEFSMKATFILSATALVFMFLINITLVEAKSAKMGNNLKEFTKETIKFVLHNSKIKWCIFFFAFTNLMIWGTYFLYQPYFQKLEIPVMFFGIIFAGLNLIAFFSSIYFSKIKKYFNNFNIIYLILILIIIPFFFIYNFFSMPFIVFLVLHQISRGFLSPFISQLINTFVNSQNRATILSINNMFSRGVQFIFFPVIGYLTDWLDIRLTFLILFIFSTIFSIIILRKFHKIFDKQYLS